MCLLPSYWTCQPWWLQTYLSSLGSSLLWWTLQLSLPCLQSSLQEVRTGIQTGVWRQVLMQMPWRGAAHCLVPHGLLSLLLKAYRSTIPRIAPSTMSYTLSLWSFTKKMLSRPASSLMVEAFSQLWFSPLRWCQLVLSWHKIILDTSCWLTVT